MSQLGISGKHFLYFLIETQYCPGGGDWMICKPRLCFFCQKMKSLMWVKHCHKMSQTIPQITVNWWYKPFPNGWFVLFYPHYSQSSSIFCSFLWHLKGMKTRLKGPHKSDTNPNQCHDKRRQVG